MAPTKRKKTQLTPDGLKQIRDDKPVVYKIRDAKGENIYTGSAKRGRVEDRLREHLPGGKDSVAGGRTVEIDQKSSIDEARQSEARTIKRSQPKHNKRGK
jgi:excinuclease UvrABC nuclease subunit